MPWQQTRHVYQQLPSCCYDAIFQNIVFAEMTGFGDIFFDFDDEVIAEEVNEAFNATPGVIFLVDVRNRMFVSDDGMQAQPVILSFEVILHSLE